MFSILLLAAAAAPDPALLDRVAERSKAIEAYSKEASLKVTVVSDELDAEGTPTRHSEFALQITRSGGEPKRTLLSATEDGKDVTEAKRAELEAPPKRNNDGGKGHGSMSQASPFHPDHRAKYAFATLPPAPAAPGLLRVAFQPAGEKSDKLMIGDATIDPETGDLVRMSMRPSKNPSFVDHLFLELEFDAVTPAGRALSKIAMKGRGGFLFVKKRFAVVTTFSDYRARE